MDSMARITLEHVTKKFGKVVAVNDMNLEIKDGEFVVLVGPSGCGKTTTLRLIAGLEFPTEGRIYMDDEDITYVHPKNRKMSMVFQSYALYPHMTVFNNLAFPLQMKKLPKNEIEEKVKKAAEFLRISDLLYRKPKELSGGQKQRVALGRALIKEPKVFLMDEPLSNVDAILRVYLRGEIKALQRELGISTVYVTHDQLEAMTMADRIAVMNEGVLHQIGKPEEVYSNPDTSFVAGFIGSPPMNLIDCSLVERNGKLFVDLGMFLIDLPDSAVLEKVSGSEVLLGIRPADILVSREKTNIDFTASVYSLEPLGTETILILKSGDTIVRTGVPADFKLSIGEQVGVSFNRKRMYIFDKATSKKLDIYA